MNNAQVNPQTVIDNLLQKITQLILEIAVKDAYITQLNERSSENVTPSDSGEGDQNAHWS